MGIKVESMEPEVWDAVRAIARDEVSIAAQPTTVAKPAGELADKPKKPVIAVISVPKARPKKKSRKKGKAIVGVVLALLMVGAVGCLSPAEAEMDSPPLGLIRPRNLDLEYEGAVWAFATTVGTPRITADIINYGGLSTNTSSALVVDCSPSISALGAGVLVSFVAHTDCNAAATLNVDGLGAKNIFEASDVSAVESGDLAAGAGVLVIYDGTQFQQISQSGN